MSYLWQASNAKSLISSFISHLQKLEHENQLVNLSTNYQFLFKCQTWQPVINSFVLFPRLQVVVEIGYVSSRGVVRQWVSVDDSILEMNLRSSNFITELIFIALSRGQSELRPNFCSMP